MESAIRIRIDETVEIKVPAEGAEEVIAFEIGLALLAFDETTGSARADPFEQRDNHALKPRPLQQALS